MKGVVVEERERQKVFLSRLMQHGQTLLGLDDIKIAQLLQLPASQVISHENLSRYVICETDDHRKV
jgi:hypothetical protein